MPSKQSVPVFIKGDTDMSFDINITNSLFIYIKQCLLFAFMFNYEKQKFLQFNVELSHTNCSPDLAQHAKKVTTTF